MWQASFPAAVDLAEPIMAYNLMDGAIGQAIHFGSRWADRFPAVA